MFGLKKCKEQDFYQFKYINSIYNPSDINARIFGGILYSVIFFGIASFYFSQSKIKCPDFLSFGASIFIILDIIIFILCTINHNKYAYKYQKWMIVAVIINWIVMALGIYPFPLIIACYESNIFMITVILGIMIVGFLYFLFCIIKLIYLIKKGKMTEGNLDPMQVVFGKNIVYLGFSVPLIVFVSKMARRTTIEMNKSGNSVGPLILMVIFAAVLQIVMSANAAICIVLAYCKFRFQSYNIPGDPKVRERMYKLEQRRKRRERNNMQMIKKDDNNNQKKRKKHKKRNKQ